MVLRGRHDGLSEWHMSANLTRLGTRWTSEFSVSLAGGIGGVLKAACWIKHGDGTKLCAHKSASVTLARGRIDTTIDLVSESQGKALARCIYTFTTAINCFLTNMKNYTPHSCPYPLHHAYMYLVYTRHPSET